MKKTLFLVLMLLVALPLIVAGQTPFAFMDQVVEPGTKQHFNIALTDGEYETTIPITVFHGATDGPVLGITAGVHGYEYAPILAGQRLINKIAPSGLQGTVILVQIANVGSFLGRSPYINPADGKNLNRVFPGKTEGSITERVADFISKNVISRSDYFVDMHSGDAPEDLMAYSAYYQNDEKPEVSENGRQMAMHMGFDHVIVFKTTGKSYLEAGNPSRYCSAEAFKQGIPAVDIECGRLGMVETEFVDKIIVGVQHLLVHLKMKTGVSPSVEGMLFIDERAQQYSEHTGFFYPKKSSGDYIKQGMEIGQITDFFGRPLQTIYAKTSGIILYMLGTPPVNKGETLVNIGIVNK